MFFVICLPVTKCLIDQFGSQPRELKVAYSNFNEHKQATIIITVYVGYFSCILSSKRNSKTVYTAHIIFTHLFINIMRKHTLHMISILTEPCSFELQLCE